MVVHRYRALHVWGGLLTAVGVVQLLTTLVGVVLLAVAVEGAWLTAGVVLLAGPLLLLLATWPFALAQAMRALADVAESVAGSGAPTGTAAGR